MAQTEFTDLEQAALDPAAAAQRRTVRAMQAGIAALMGLGLFIGVALSHPATIHNAAHDSRHGIAVPCH